MKLRTQEREQKKAAGRWQGELQRFWTQFIHRNHDAFPFLGHRSAPKVNKLSFKKADTHELRFFVLKNCAYVSCKIGLPEDEEMQKMAIAILAREREVINEIYGSDLEWMERPQRSALILSEEIA